MFDLQQFIVSNPYIALALAAAAGWYVGKRGIGVKVTQPETAAPAPKPEEKPK